MLTRIIRHLRFRLGYELPHYLTEHSPSVGARYLVRRPFTRARTIGAAPRDFHRHSAIFKATRMLGVRQRRGWWAGPSICWGEPPFPTAPPHALNARCRSVDKGVVEQVFREAFGYGYAVDPVTHRGPMVRKSEVNAVHDGRVEQGPIAAAEPGFAYQRLINNQVSDTETEDIRVPVIRGNIPFVYLKRRLVGSRFGYPTVHSTVEETAAVITAGEQKSIVSFCDRMGLDYAELDVLRDCDDGRIYIVDANNTPVGPPPGLSYTTGVRAMRRLARALDKSWLRAK